MIRTQQTNDDDGDMQRDNGERDGVPCIENEFFKKEVGMLATRKDTPRVAALADGCLYERAVVTATVQTVLDTQTPVFA
jgi:hypothetical protein